MMGCACSGQYGSAGRWQDGMGVLLSAQACCGESADPRSECSAAIGGHQCMESTRTSRHMPFLSVRTAVRRMPFSMSAWTAVRHMSPPCLRRRQCGAAQWKGKKRMKTVYRVRQRQGRGGKRRSAGAGFPAPSASGCRVYCKMAGQCGRMYCKMAGQYGHVYCKMAGQYGRMYCKVAGSMAVCTVR